MSTMPEAQVLVTIGVDTHADSHVAAALDHLGRELGTFTIATTLRGFNELIEWASQFGVIDRIGVEGTGCWGAGLARWLRAEGFVVVEVDRPKPPYPPAPRQVRHDRRAGRRPRGAVRRGERHPQGRRRHCGGHPGAACGLPLGGQGPHPGRQPAARPGRHRPPRAARATASPAAARARRGGRTAASRRHPRQRRGGHQVHAATPGTPLPAARPRSRRTQDPHGTASRSRGPDPARRAGHQHAHRSRPARGSGDNPERLRSEGSFAHLCGVAPLDASSGKQQRHRLNRGGDRQANCALHTVAIVRMSHDETTKKYVARRLSEGKTKREAIRCLKRYLARDIYRLLVPIMTPDPALDTT